jgi:putative sterol carrier protein
VVRFLSDEWLAEAAALTAADGNDDAVCVVEQVVRCHDGDVRYQLRVAANAARLEPHPAGKADLQIVEDYEIAVAISRGELDPGSALASGRITIRGDAARLAAVADALAGIGDVLAPLRDRTEY